jgi:hypothetical protein
LGKAVGEVIAVDFEFHAGRPDEVWAETNKR